MDHSSSHIDASALLANTNKAKTAIVYKGRNVSYAWLDETSRRLAGGISRVLQPGQPLALWLHNSPELIALYLACLRCGVMPVPLRCEMRQTELTRILQATSARLLVSSSRLMSNVDDTFCHRLDRIFSINETDLHSGLESWSVLLADKMPGCSVERDKKSPAFILATSGSEGESKAVVLSVDNLEQILSCRNRIAGVDSGSIAVTASCLTQSVGLHQVLGMLAAGGLIVLLESYDTDLMADAINHYRPTHLIMVVHAFSQLLDHPGITSDSFKNIQFASVGADRVTARVQKHYISLTNRPLSVTYGLTESSWALVNNSGRLDKALAIGRPEASVKIRLVDNSGVELGDNTVGEIQIRSPRTMLGYLNAPRRTDEVLVDGWLSSGDLAYRDDEGFYWFAGRKKNLIVLNTGDTVSPVEVEQVLSQYDGVLDCMVTSTVSKENHSEIPIAYIVPRDKTLTHEALHQHLDKHLSSYKHPQQFHFVPTLPTGETGKLLRVLPN